MPHYLITANINLAPDGAGFRGYQPGHPVATVGWYSVEADGFAAAAHVMFAIGNRMGTDKDGQRWPDDVRTLSVGDVLYLAEGNETVTTGVRILAVCHLGWTEVPQPSDHCQVPLPGPPAYDVVERTYSWGTHAQLYRHGRRTLAADLYRDGTYRVITI